MGSDEYLRGQRRIALIFEVHGRARAAQPQGAREDVSARVMRVVARHAAARHDFERHRKRLAEAGRTFELPELLDLVAAELPGWCPWLDEAPPARASNTSRSARAALGRLVTHGKKQAEKGERFVELSKAAARLAGKGSLDRAAAAVAVAELLVGEAAAPPEAVQSGRATGFGRSAGEGRSDCGGRRPRSRPSPPRGLPEADRTLPAARRIRGPRERPEGGGDARAAAPRRAPGAEQPISLPADGLPGLLHELAVSSASGSLTLEDKGAADGASLTLSEGRLVAARARALSGADAVHQLLETFEGGKAVWTLHPETKGTPLFETDALALGPLALEGLQRRDERELSRDLAPDSAVLAVRTPTPRPHPDEKDGLLTRDVWGAVSAGRTPLECETELPFEAFRIRRLLLHWVDEGALQAVFRAPGSGS